MGERDTARLDAALVALADDLDVPRTPALAGSVTSRLLADRAAGVRSPLPGRALWTPRMRLVAVIVATLAVLALAAGARYVIGAAEIRVDPGAVPTGPPLLPRSLGEPAPLHGLEDVLGFAIELPAGPRPDAIYVSGAGDGAAIFAWRPGERSPRLPGTPWGLIVIEVAGGDDEVLVKRVNAFEDTEEVVLDGQPAFWIEAPHELLIVTEHGDERFRVNGNVLIWDRDGVTYRLETPLGFDEALAVAESFEPA